MSNFSITLSLMAVRIFTHGHYCNSLFLEGGSRSCLGFEEVLESFWGHDINKTHTV